MTPHPPAQVATWYAKGLPRPEALTAASTTHPRGTRLKVHHRGKTVVVVVNDFGPEAWTGAHIDLSRGAFKVLAPLSVGRINVRIEVIDAGIKSRTRRLPADRNGAGGGQHEAQSSPRLAGSTVPGPWWPASLHRVQEVRCSWSEVAVVHSLQTSRAWLSCGDLR